MRETIKRTRKPNVSPFFSGILELFLVGLSKGKNNILFLKSIYKIQTQIKILFRNDKYKISIITNLKIIQKMQIQGQSKAPQQVQEQTEPQVQTLLLQIKDILVAIDKSVTNKELRTAVRLSRQVRKFRDIIDGHHLLALSSHLGLTVHENLLQASSTYKKDFKQTFDLGKQMQGRFNKVLELECFVKILFMLFHWRNKNFAQCQQIVQDLRPKVQAANRRTLDSYGALLYFYLIRLHEKNGSDLTQRQILLDAYNKSCVRSDQLGQSTLLNLLLRNYLRHRHFDAAFNLIEMTSFPEGKSNNQYCKYLYYTGQVKAVRREYGDSLQRLNQAIRKSPDSAKGFKLQCQRVAIVVELLMGDVPNRQIFTDRLTYQHSYAYYKLIQAVLEGSLSNFDTIVTKYKETFQRDKLYKLILRLNQTVIRIGLRKIYIAYSNISLSDIACKLNIPNQDVEFVVAKALRDGILNGEIDHQSQILKIEGDRNLYVTNQPQQALDSRIRYCLGLYHDTQRAITYPDMRAKQIQNEAEGQIDAEELLGLFDFDDDL